MALSVHYVAAFVAASTGFLVWSHWSKYGVLNYPQIGLALFSVINAMICYWELSLFYYRKLVSDQYDGLKRKLEAGMLPQPMFMYQPVTFLEAVGLKHWAKVWSTYSVMDPSYSDTTTFGFMVDIGNGHVTLIPTILFALCMTWDVLPARIMGIIGIVMHWQELYGTLLYFVSYVLNQRWKGRPGLSTVITSNMVWVLGPGYGMYICYRFIMEGSYDAVRV